MLKIIVSIVSYVRDLHLYVVNDLWNRYTQFLFVTKSPV